MKNAWLFAVIALLAGLSCAGYDNDGPNMRPGSSRDSSTIAYSSSGSISGFAPYKPSDVLIVVTNFADRGKERWTGEEIKIPFTIDRYFGNRDKMIKSGALPKSVLIEMINYDVDSSAAASPAEYDEVWVNGKKLKQTLTGENGAWTKQSLLVDTRYLKFPETVGRPAQNEVVIKVATKGGRWVTKVDWISLHIPAAPPVVLSHGINSSASDLSKIKKEIDDLGIPTIAFDQENHGNESIYKIDRLTEIVKLWKAVWRVDHVNIVGHSMGGLRARRYAEDNDDVFKVLQIASPNGGSPFADFMVDWRTHYDGLIAAELESGEMDREEANLVRARARRLVRRFAEDRLNMALDPWTDKAIESLQTDSMAEYNSRHSLSPNVGYGVVAGNVTDFGARDVADTLLVLRGEEVESSLRSLIEDLRQTANSADPATWVFDPDYLSSRLVGLYQSLSRNSDLIVPVRSAHTLVPALPGSPLTGGFDEVWHSGLIAKGASRSVNALRNELTKRKMTSGSPKASTGGQKSASVVAPRVMLSSSRGETADRQRSLKTGLCTNGAKVEVDVGIAGGGAAAVVLALAGESEPSSFSMTSPSGKTYTTSDAGVIIDCSATCLAILLSPEAGTWKLSFAPKGAAGAEAAWILRTIETDDPLSFSVESESASIRRGDSFTIRAKATMNGSPAQGSVLASVVKPDGSAFNIHFTSEGSGMFSASFKADCAGNYQVLASFSSATVASAGRSCQLTLNAHEADSAFDGTASLSVADADSDGLYDSLTVKLGVNLASGGKYRVAATLSDADGQVVANGWSGVFAGSGNMSVPVAFDGATIYSHGATTQYVVSEAKLYEISDEYEAEVDVRADLVSTSAFSYDQFAHPMVRFGTGSDVAMDADGNGVYDSLNVLLPLLSERTISGKYSWSAALQDSTGMTLGTASGTVKFPSGGGSTSVSMSFSASDMATSHVNGPYCVRNFILWRTGGSGPDTFELSDEYKTAPYAIADFGGVLATADLGFFVPDGWSGPLIVSAKASGKSFQKTHNQGDPIYLNYAFANIAGSAGVKNVSNKFTLSNGSTFVDTWKALGASKYGWLGDGVAPEFLQNLKPGTYKLTCELDADEQLPEKDEYNNLQEVTFTVKATSRPNLKIVSASFSRSTIAKSESMTVHWRIENKGKQPAKKSKTLLRIYDTKTNKLKKTISVDCPPLAVGGGAEFAKSISGKTFGVGKFEIDILADGKGSLKETDKSDNVKWGTVTVTKDRASKSSSKVDWRFHKRKSSEPDSFFLSNSSKMKKKTTKFKKGQKIYMRCGWWNATKKAVSGKMRVDVYLNGVSGVYFDRTSWGKGSWWWNSNATPSFLQKLPAGKYTLTAVLDSENSWKEKNEKNNIRTISFTVEGTPTVYANSSYTCAVGESVSWPITTEGKLTVGKLPKGLKYSGGAITGKPTQKGTYTVKLVSKNLKGKVTKKIKIVVTAKKSSAFLASRAKSAKVLSATGSDVDSKWAVGEYGGFSDEANVDDCFVSFAISSSGELSGNLYRGNEKWSLTAYGQVGCDESVKAVVLPVALTCGDDEAFGMIEIYRGCDGQPDGTVSFDLFCEGVKGDAFELSGVRSSE